MRLSTDEPQRAARGLITSGFPDVHARKRSCLVPPKAMSSVSTSRSPLPRHPGPRTTEPPRPANFTHFEVLIPLRVRSRRPERTRVGGRYSLGFRLPFRDLHGPRSLDPAQFRGSGHAPSPGGSSARPRGQQPPTPGETFLTQQATPSPSLAATRSLPIGLHRLSAATPSPLTFDPTEQARSCLAFGASKYPRSDAPPKSNASLS